MPVRIRDHSSISSLERRIATALILDRNFLAGFEGMWGSEGQPIRARWLDTLIRWCLGYWRQYRRPPARDIQPIHEQWARDNGDKQQGEILAHILSSLSREYEQQEEERPNTQYLLDQTHEWLTREGLGILADDIRASLDTGEKPTQVEEWVAGWRAPQRVAQVGGNPFTDKEGWRAAYEEAEDPLFTFPGSLGEMIGPVGRGEFASFMGPEKRGKTWWLLFTAICALKSRCRVAYFQLGDLTQAQVYRRLGTYMTGRSHLRRHCKGRWVPVLDCALNQSGDCSHAPGNSPLKKVRDKGEKEERTLLPPEGNTGWVPCTKCRQKGSRKWQGAAWVRRKPDTEPLQWDEAWDAGQGYLRKYGDRLRMHFSHNNQTSVRDMEAILDRWEREDGFVPDVVVADYADLWRADDTRMDFRHQQNDTWSRARGLSMERHVALITATQADAASYSARSIRAKHFSEDKRKYGHVSLGMWTLNQTPEEKRLRVMRIGRMFVREDDFSEQDCCYILQDLGGGRPYVGGWRPGRKRAEEGEEA